MLIRTTIIILLLTAPFLARSQSNGKVTGKTSNAIDKQHLEGATISALNAQTGLFIKHAVSNKKGDFQLSGLPLNDSIAVIVSFTGFRDTSSVIYLTHEKRELQSGNWRLQAADELEEVTVMGRKPPFIIKNDTLEFNASAFKSLPTDMVRELLRKLPGMVMDEEGNITVNGKKVNKIKVDGRDFFDGNLKMAAENLPAGVIEKVKVYETRERGDQYNSVIQPNNKELTLDLSLKKENRKGSFGIARASYGTEERWSARAMINAFNEGKRYSIFGTTGNVSGGGNQIMFGPGGEDGIIKNNIAAGININDGLGKKGRLDLNYMVNSNSQGTITNIERTNLLPDSSFLYNSDAVADSKNKTHALRANLQLVQDSLQSLTVTPQITYSDNSNTAMTTAASSTVTGELINSQENSNTGRNKSITLANGINYNRASADGKTNLTFNWNINIRQERGDQLNRSLNAFYNPNAGHTDSLNQEGDIHLNGVSNNASLNIYRRLTKRFVGILNYSFNQNGDGYDKDVFNYNNGTGKHDMLDSLYSIHNNNKGITHLPGASIGYSGNKFSAELGAGMRISRQDNTVVWKDSTVTIQQRNFTPRATFSYQLNKNSRVVANYSVNSDQPSPEQLAPVQDNTNPLYIKLGNPFLKSSISHQFNTEVSYHTSDYRWHAALRGSGNVNTNQIVEDMYYDAGGRQISTWQNVNGVKQFQMDLRGGTRIRFSEYNINFEASSGINSSNSAGFVNRQQNNSHTLQFNPQLNLGVNFKDRFSLHANAGVDINSTKYSLDGLDDISYNTKRLMFFANWVPVKRLNISSSVFHFYNSQLPEDFQRARTLLNTSITYNFLKSEKLTVGLAVNDILNNNVSVSRTVSPTAIETRQINALRRYGMLTVNYRLSNFNGAMIF